MLNTLLLIFAPTLATQWDKGSDTAMKNHRRRSAFYRHFSGVCSVPGSVLAAVGQAARVSTAFPELTVCWRDQLLHMTLLMWWDYHKGSSHMQLPQSHPMQWVEPCMCVCVCVCVYSVASLCNPMDCSPPGSSIHGILQARILGWVAISFSRGMFCISHIGRQILYH